jgi:hypothetical protein
MGGGNYPVHSVHPCITNSIAYVPVLGNIYKEREIGRIKEMEGQKQEIKTS